MASTVGSEKHASHVEQFDVTADVEKNQSESTKGYRFPDLFRYASRKDMWMLKIGLICSIALGAAFPFTILVFRLIVNDFVNTDMASLSKDVYRTSVWFLAIAICAFFLAFVQTSFVSLSSGKIAHRIRMKFLEAIFRQDMSWLDTQSVGNLMSQLVDDTDSIQIGIGAKMTEFTQNISSFVFGLTIALFTGWKLTLVACCMLPLILFGFMSFRGLTAHFVAKEAAAYSEASRIAEEVFRAIRTVFAFGGEKRELNRYTKHLDEAARVGVKQSTCYGLAAGFIGFSIYCSAALVFWYGVSLLRQGEYDAGSVVLVFLNVIIGSLFLGGALPNFRYFFAAKAAGQRLFSVVDRKPPIDRTVKGQRPDTFFQSITFENVMFAYASRPDSLVLNNISFAIRRHQTVAFVGPSGCGKSTLLHLIQRFYDADHGQIKIDGIPITDLDLPWYRSQIGIVNQEPVIFPGTILENIQLGNLEATREQIEEAAKLANAHQFIVKLPDAYNTKLTQSGTALSVGQKQRLAIARALVRSPPILILDEATSALDSLPEFTVQSELERAASKRTIILVAHRLSTVRNADRIFVIEKGRVCESGTHAELCASNGLYAAMWKAQNISLEHGPLLDEDVVTSDLDEEIISKPISNGSDVHSALLESNRPGTWQSTESLQSSGSKRSVNAKRAPQRHMSSGFLRVLRLNRPELCFILVGTFSAMVTGAIQPVFAIMYSEIYAIFTMQSQADMQSRINLLAWIMALLGLCRLLSSVSQAYFFGQSGQRLTKRLRRLLFEAYLRQEMSWFDKQENQVGALTVQLATETNKVHPFCGSAMGLVVESLVLVLFSLAIGFFYNWKLTLVVVVFFPMIVLSSFFNMNLFRRKTAETGVSDAAQVAHSALSAIKTVTSFGLEEHFSHRYVFHLRSEMKSQKRKSLGFGVVYALSQSLPICSYAAAFSFGAYMISRGEIELLAIFRVFAAISFAAQALGRTSHLGPEMRRASRAASRIFDVLDRRPAIVTDQGLEPDFSLNSVSIELKHVTFAYATRPKTPVLRNLSFTITPGQTVAVVGHSGCGKTSLFKLLIRLYDLRTNKGSSAHGLFIGPHRMDQIAPSWLRKQVGLVEQEPHLFNLTIGENIAYGDNSRLVNQDEIEEAAKQAQIHDFISSLKAGYDTPVGPQGCELSVGQKQRVAIARLIVHQPNLILLDEATAALDPQTEAQLQDAMITASQNRTVLISAHRLSALKHVDRAIVLADGAMVETGEPAELMLARGAYYSLFHAQLVQQ